MSRPADFFRVAHPEHSAAGIAGFCMSTIYTSADGPRAMLAAAKGYLEPVQVDDRRFH